MDRAFKTDAAQPVLPPCEPTDFERLSSLYRLDFHTYRSALRRDAIFDWSALEAEFGWDSSFLADVSETANAAHAAVAERIGAHAVRLMNPAEALPLSFDAPPAGADVVRLLVDAGNQAGIEIRFLDQPDVSPAKVGAVAEELVALLALAPELNVTSLSFEATDLASTGWWSNDHEMCIHLDLGLITGGDSSPALARLRDRVADRLVVATSREPVVGEVQRAFGSRLALDLERRAPDISNELNALLARLVHLRVPKASMLWPASPSLELPGAEAVRQRLARQISETASQSATGLLSEMVVLGRDPLSDDAAGTQLMAWLTSFLPQSEWDFDSTQCVA